MTFTTTTLRKLRALGLDQPTFDAVLEIFEDAQLSKPKKKGCAADRAERATRLPEDWALPAEYSDAAQKMGLRPSEITREAMKFKNYWLNQPGPKGAKLLWGRTWENWCLSTLERAGRAPILPESIPNPLIEGPEAFTEATWAAISRRFKRTGQWNPAYGPEPGRMDCKMPEAYL